MDFKAFLKLIGVVLLLSVAFQHISNLGNNGSLFNKSGSNTNPMLVTNMNYTIKNIPQSVVEYLENSSEIKDLYKGNKKIVYYFFAPGCPYAEAFRDAVQTSKTNNAISSKYVFYEQKAFGCKTYSTQKEQRADLAFNRLCQEFCIINTKNNKIFSVNGLGKNEAEQLDTVLNQLKNW